MRSHVYRPTSTLYQARVDVPVDISHEVGPPLRTGSSFCNGFSTSKTRGAALASLQGPKDVGCPTPSVPLFYPPPPQARFRTYVWYMKTRPPPVRPPPIGTEGFPRPIPRAPCPNLWTPATARSSKTISRPLPLPCKALCPKPGPAVHLMMMCDAGHAGPPQAYMAMARSHTNLPFRHPTTATHLQWPLHPAQVHGCRHRQLASMTLLPWRGSAKPKRLEE